MHDSSLYRMKTFTEKYLSDRHGSPLTILDVGSFDFNGTYQCYFTDPVWKYTGLDLEPGKNVDIVVGKDPYHWPIDDGAFDVVISGQAFEHIPYFWLTMQEIGRVVKPGGYVCVIAPSAGSVHRFPVDCWRFYEDGMKTLAEYVDLEVLETGIHSIDEFKCDNAWRDAYLIARKP